MANRIPRISKRSVDAVKAGGTDAVYWDGELTGFGLRVRRSGRKSYVVQTRIARKLCWFTIGPHGPLNPDQARARALEILACAKKGIDPRDADARREAEPSMADLGRRFLEEYVPVHCKPSTRGEYSRSVRLFVDPVIGELRVPEVQRKDIVNRPRFTGERLVQILGCFFMCVQGFIEHLLCFVRRDISDGAVKTLGVVPIDPFQRFPFKLAH